MIGISRQGGRKGWKNQETGETEGFGGGKEQLEVLRKGHSFL